MKKYFIALLLASLMVFPLTAGGSKEEITTDDAFGWVEKEMVNGLPGVNPLKVTGNIVSAGSSTVFPLSERMAERFISEGYNGTITVDSIGSGAGFERFTVAGESDISNASRPIKQKEIDQAKSIGRNPIEFKVGTDAIAVTVSKKNTFVKDVTKKELARIFGSAIYWSDVRSNWPKVEIQRFIPGTDSGTFDYFVEEIFKTDPTPMLSAKNVQLSEDDNMLVTGIKGSEYAVGFFGYAYYVENKDTLNVLNIEGVEASTATVNDGIYPLARPLFLYSDATIMREKPQVAAFIDFYLAYVNEEVTSVGYFPASEESLAFSRASWLEAMKGTY
ncbi:MAG: PstS family phosphate ABC transporter substrate-binding protein [Spirochaetia bacterium]|nr:PstS family phosphate ABC transporter substrate-binding protein [Spirochaetia bacterium]